MQIVDQHHNFLHPWCLHNAFDNGEPKIFDQHAAPTPEENDWIDLQIETFELSHASFSRVAQCRDDRKKIVDAHEFAVSLELSQEGSAPNHHAWVDHMRWKDEVVETDSIRNPNLVVPLGDQDSFDGNNIDSDSDDEEDEQEG